MRLAADDAVEGVALRPAPRRQEKTPRRDMFFAVERLEKRDELVTEGEHAVRVVGEDFTQRLIGRVVDDISTRLRLLRFIDFENAGDVVVPLLDRVASPLCGLVFLQLKRLEVYGESACRRFILLA